MMMSKFTKFLTVAIVLFFGVNIVNAQCIPDPDCVDPEGDGQFCPTEFTPAIEDEYYEEVLTIIIPAQMQNITIHHIDILSIENIPPGMIYECQDNDCSLWPQTPKCIKISGTPEIDSWGEYKLHLVLEVFMDLYGNPVSLGEIEDSSAVVTIESQLHADFNIAYGIGGVVCNNDQTTITYTGDASEAAFYNWDFGNHVSVVSGEGAGPYVIEYTEGYTGMDSVSLFVQEAPYTSPAITEVFMVDYCTSVFDKENSASYSFYPNPMNDVLNIKSANYESAKAFLYDLSGKEILRTEIHQGITSMDISFLQKGIYFLSITNSRTTSTHKIIKK